jgi:hypothetical protein
LGENWVRLAETLGTAGWIVAGLAVLAAAAHFVHSRRRERRAAARAEASAAGEAGDEPVDVPAA